MTLLCAASDIRDRVAVTYPGQTKLVFWVKAGDRYAVQASSTMQSIERRPLRGQDTQL